MHILINNTNNHISKSIFKKLENLNNNLYISENHKISNATNKLDFILFLNNSYDLQECENISNSETQKHIKILKKLCEISKLNNIPLFYISSSEVYGDTELNSNQENEICKPINALGRTCYLYEKTIKDSTPYFYILRTSWLFGTESCYIKNIIYNSNTPLFFCSEKIVNPTNIDFLIETIITLNTQKNYGIFNCASKEPISKLNLTKNIFNFINIPKEVSKIPLEIKNKLPKSNENSFLDSSLLAETFNIKLPNSTQDVYSYIINLFE